MSVEISARIDRAHRDALLVLLANRGSTLLSFNVLRVAFVVRTQHQLAIELDLTTAGTLLVVVILELLEINGVRSYSSAEQDGSQDEKRAPDELAGASIDGMAR